jgi:glutamate formiminotransferase/glutamate formiminotransferase/formiminotetrahydrofolate cyclodeaminase
MNQIVECVPNFSEGRRIETITRVAAAIASVDQAFVLGTHLDADHNRSVITFAAPPEKVVEAALRSVATAAELIDLRQHSGQHPRIGATDVLPFVPVRGVTMDQCVVLAHEAGQRIARDLQIPVYFYGQAARRPDRSRLENVRQRGFEELRERIAIDPLRAPDLGPHRVHETAGAIEPSARALPDRVQCQSAQPKHINCPERLPERSRRDGDLPFLKALGFIELKSRGLVQVSMNLVNYERTGMDEVFTVIQRQADTLGVEIAGAEIVGLVPEAALDRSAAYFPLLENFTESLILENRLSAGLKAR